MKGLFKNTMENVTIKIQYLNDEIKSREKIINEITSSNSWKVTAPMRKIKKNLK